MNSCNYVMEKIRLSLIFEPPDFITKQGLKSKPDFVLHRDGFLYSVGEIKTVFDLRTPKGDESLVLWWNDEFII